MPVFKPVASVWVSLVPHPCPHHCPPEGGGGLALLAWALILAALVTLAVLIAVWLRRRQLTARPPVRLVSSRSIGPITASRPREIQPRRTVAKQSPR
jgi:uncharacterized protein (DUF58 family)